MNYKDGPHDVFNALEDIIDILEQDNDCEELFYDLEFAFRLINAEKSDKRYKRQFSHVAKNISHKNPDLANALTTLEKIATKSHELINFDLLTKYGIFCREKLEKQVPKPGNLAETSKIREILKSRNLLSSYLEENE